EAREWLGEPTPEIFAAVEDKRRFVSALGRWPKTRAEWDEVRSRIAPSLELFGDVEHALTVAGIPDEPGYLDIDERTLRATFRYSNRLRARATRGERAHCERAHAVDRRRRERLGRQPPAPPHRRERDRQASQAPGSRRGQPPSWRRAQHHAFLVGKGGRHGRCLVHAEKRRD